MKPALACLLALAAVALVGAACGGKKGSPSAAPVEVAPVPFTAEEIRAATEPGRTYTFRVTEHGEAPTMQRIRFLTVDDTGATTSSVTLDAEGKPIGEPKKATATWHDLVGHATYPKITTTISEATVTVPAGTFEAKRYTVANDAADETLVIDFAKTLPGAPVSHVTKAGGSIVHEMVLVEHRPGRRAPK